MKILVLGSNGQLGSEIRYLSMKKLPKANFIFFDKTNLDITQQNQLDRAFKIHRPDFVINCAAYTQVDKAEMEWKLNEKVNADATAKIAITCQQYNSILIHFSSDYVYDIESQTPLLETDKTNPQSAYAKSKLAGENAILKILDQHVIIRTSWVYSSFGKNFVKSMIRLGKTKDELYIVNDQIGSPTYACDLANASLEIVKSIDQNSNSKYFGIFNYSNLGVTHWADFAKKIFQLCHIECKVNEITTADFGAAAPRPLWSVLSKQKIQNTFDLKIRHWETALSVCLEKINIDN